MTPAFLLGLLILPAGYICDSGEVRDVWDDAESFLQEFIRIVVNATDASFEHLDEIDSQVRISIAVNYAVASNAIGSVTTRINNILHEFREEAEDAASQAAVDRCIGLYQDEIDELGSSLHTLVPTCIQDLETEALSEISKARTVVGSYLNLADLFRRDIDQCYIAPDGNECIASVTIEILLQSLEVPLTIEEDMKRTRDLATSYEDALPLCYTDRITNANLVAQLIITSIRDCAQLSSNQISN